MFFLNLMSLVHHRYEAKLSNAMDILGFVKKTRANRSLHLKP